jgi:hypothetical protein
MNIVLNTKIKNKIKLDGQSHYKWNKSMVETLQLMGSNQIR